MEDGARRGLNLPTPVGQLPAPTCLWPPAPLSPEPAHGPLPPRESAALSTEGVPYLPGHAGGAVQHRPGTDVLPILPRTPTA